MEFLLGVIVGAIGGVVLSVLLALVLAVLIRRAIRNRRRNFMNIGAWLARQSKKNAARYRKMYEHVVSVSCPISIKVTKDDGKPLTPEQHGIVLIFNGIDVIARQSDMDPVVLDQLIQHGLSYVADAAAQPRPDEPA